jgi:hypothetical protein
MFRLYDHLQVEIYTSEITLLTTDPLLLGLGLVTITGTCHYYYPSL